MVDDRRIEATLKERLDSEVAELKWKSVLTSLLAPCVVGHHRTSMLLVSNITTTLTLVVCLAWLPLAATHFTSWELWDEAPVTHCFRREAVGGGGVTVNHTEEGEAGGTLFCHYDADAALVFDCGQDRIHRCGEGINS